MCLLITTSCIYGNNKSGAPSEENEQSEKLIYFYNDRAYNVEIKEKAQGLVTDEMIMNVIKRCPEGGNIIIYDVDGDIDGITNQQQEIVIRIIK